MLQFAKSIYNDADNVNETALFNVLKEDVKAKKCDLDSLYKIQPHRIQLQDDDDLFEEALMEAATTGDGSFQLLFQTPTRYWQ